ncbi:MAG: hypothetical protein KF858_07800 [Candidatus Sumerlaeia bacterium]|nr:hypothetical protein [Candidatus Sumerlaeia bacterium]
MAPDLEPAFPRWLRRADPWLATEDSNTLYQLFRARRLSKRPSLPGILGRIVAIFLALLGVLLCFTFVLFSCLFCIAPLIPPACFALWLPLSWHRQRRPNPEPRLPATVSGIFSYRCCLTQAATDIWLVGFSGREVLEAIFLEHRERSWALVTGMAIVFLLAVPLFYLLAVGRIALPNLMLLGLWAASAKQVVRLVHVVAAMLGRVVILWPRMRCWRFDKQWSEVIGDAVTHGLGAVAGVIFLWFCLYGCLSAGVELLFPYSRYSRSPYSWETFITGHQSDWIAVPFAILLAVLLPGIRHRQSRLEADSRERLLAQADAAWERFMRAAVFHDPDGAPPLPPPAPPQEVGSTTEGGR